MQYYIYRLGYFAIEEHFFGPSELLKLVHKIGQNKPEIHEMLKMMNTNVITDVFI